MNFEADGLRGVRACWATHSVTPADQMSTLNPEKVSSPLAISGGWKAGEPWLVRHVSSSANGWRAWKSAETKQWGTEHVHLHVEVDYEE